MSLNVSPFRLFREIKKQTNKSIRFNWTLCVCVWVIPVLGSSTPPRPRPFQDRPHPCGCAHFFHMAPSRPSNVTRMSSQTPQADPTPNNTAHRDGGSNHNHTTPHRGGLIWGGRPHRHPIYIYIICCGWWQHHHKHHHHHHQHYHYHG